MGRVVQTTHSPRIGRGYPPPVGGEGVSAPDFLDPTTTSMLRTIHRAPRALLVGLVLALAACADATGADGETDDSYVAFRFSGARAGSFLAEGDPPADNPSRATWAAAERDAGFDEILVYGAQKRTRTGHDAVALLVPDDGPGTYTLTHDCEAGCADVKLYFGSEPGDGPDEVCTLTSGTIRVDAVSQGWIRGAFSGQGSCYDPTRPTQRQITVPSGEFDVAVTDAV